MNFHERMEIHEVSQSKVVSIILIIGGHNDKTIAKHYQKQ